MTPWHAEADGDLWHGDVRDVLAQLPERSIHTCITSLPYYGLRDYGIQPSVWGGREDCEHEWGDEDAFVPRLASETESVKQRSNHGSAMTGRPSSERAFCLRCGAWRGCLGLEPTLALFLSHVVEVFAAVHRVLRDDSVCWVNVGDSYAGSWGNQGRGPERGGQRPVNGPILQPLDERYPSDGHNTGTIKDPGLKPKDLMLVPQRLAISLQEWGWWVRSAITLVKSAPMPESVTDRPTSATEMLWMLTKKADYYYDADAVREAYSPATHERARYGWGDIGPRLREHVPGYSDKRSRDTQYSELNSTGRNARNWWVWSPEPSNYDYCLACDTLWTGPGRRHVQTRTLPDGTIERRCPCGRTDAWVAHYAAFPKSLPRRAILAATSERGVCSACGAPWRRVTEPTPEYAAHLGHDWADDALDQAEGRGHFAPGIGQRRVKRNGPSLTASYKTLGWESSCTCNAGVVPATVLDPFLGSGTTAIVARELGRRWIGIDLSPEYLALSRARLRVQTPSLLGV